jgi:hypothetical protein
MWVFTVDGFFSAVSHIDQPDCVMVRARSKGDIVRLGRVIQVKKYRRTPKADYLYRLICLKTTWSAYLAKCALEIDYPNFKSKMEYLCSDYRREQLHDVWEVMAGFRKAVKIKDSLILLCRKLGKLN